MKKEKNIVMAGIIYAIVIALYNLLVFFVFKNKEGVFWISYVFMMLAFFIQIASMALSLKEADVETVFFGMPLVSFSFFYLGAEFFVSFIFMVFQGVGTAIALGLQIVVLAVYIIVAIIALMARDTVQAISKNVKDKVAQRNLAEADIDILYRGCPEPALKEKLRKLAETVKYSDPMTNDAIADVEQRIQDKTELLKRHCHFEEFEDAKKACAELEMLYAERNRKLKILK